MTMGSPTLVGVFNESSQAEDAIEQLHNAGIPDHQISYSGHTTDTPNNGFLAAIKSLFTGADTSAHSLLNDLTSMGLSQDEAQYYTNQYQAGRAIVAVNPGNDLQQVQTILNSNGSYNYQTQQTGLGTYPQQPDNDYVQARVPDYTQNAVPDSVQTRNTASTANYAQNPSLEYAQPGNLEYNPADRPTNYAQPTDQGYTHHADQPADYAQPTNQGYTNPNSQTNNYNQSGNPDDYRQPEGYSQPGNTTYDPNSRADTYAQPTNSTYDPASQTDKYAQFTNSNDYRQPEGYAQQGVVDPTSTGYVDGQGNYTNPTISNTQPGAADPTNTGYNTNQGDYTNPNLDNAGNQTAEDHQRLSDWAKREKARTDN